MNTHDHYMQRAIQEAELAQADGEVPTGCVIVHHGGDEQTRARIVGRAHNQVERLNDPTAHAEMIAITQAAATLGDWRLTNTTLYVTKEPCAMCAGAIVLARIPTVVFGVSDPKRGGAVSVFNILNHQDLIHQCDVITGILENECRAILQNFFRERRQQKKSS
jgi:tRNA(adenine34) deaminase